MSNNPLSKIKRRIGRKKKQPLPVLFDPNYYVETNPSVQTAGDLWQHFCQEGAREGLDPHPLFSTRYYQHHHLDNDATINPLEHYLDGHFSCDPHPLFDSKCYLSQLDEEFDQSISPLEHFLNHNHLNQASPTVFFDSRRYFAMYPEVEPTGMSALYHYARFGHKQGRNISIDIHQLEAVLQRKTRPDYDWLIDHWQPEIRYLAAIMRLDLSRPCIILSASRADYAYETLLKKVSSVLGSSYQANVVHLFEGNPDEAERFTTFGPSTCLGPEDDSEIQRHSAQCILAITERIGAVAAVYVDHETSEMLDRLDSLSCPKYALLPELSPRKSKQALIRLLQTCDSVLVSRSSADMVPPLQLGQLADKIRYCDSDYQAINCDDVSAEECGPGGNPFRELLAPSPDSRLIVGFGTLDLPSGFDRFVAAAITYFGQHNDSNDRFLWQGPIPKRHNKSAVSLVEDLRQAGIEDKVLFCGRADQRNEALRAADVILYTHRQQLDSSGFANCLDAGKPIVWYQGNRNVQDLMEDDGFGVAAGSSVQAVELIDALLGDSLLARQVASDNRQRREKATSVAELVHQLSGLVEARRFSHFSHQFSDADVINIVPFLKNTNRRRVIFAVPSWQISGVNTFIETLVNELCELGFDAFVLFTTPHAVTQNKSVVPNMPTRILTQQSDLSPKRRKQLLTNYLKLMSPCVFLPNYDYVASAVTPSLPDNVATLGVLHSDDPAHYVHGYRMGPYWDGIVSVSNHIHDKLMAMNPSFEDRSRVIRYGIRDQNQQIAPRSSPKDKLRVIYTGRIIQKQKMIFDFVEIANRLRIHRDQFELVFVGDGPDFGELQTLMKPHSQSGLVRLVGRVKPDNIHAHLLDSHVFALTSEYEGLPLSLIEAISAGLVPVVTDVTSGIGEILTHQQNALISPIGDPAAMAENLIHLANDCEQFNRLSQQARQTFVDCQLSARDMARQYASVLEDLFEKIQTAGHGRTEKLIYCPHIERMLNVA